MSLHADALGLLERWPAPDEGQERLRTAYVAWVAAHPDATSRSCYPAHLTVGAIVLAPDGGQVLLNLHRKARQWFHFGGHLERSDPTLAAGALRESREESGIGGLLLDAEPVHLSAHTVDFCHPRGPVQHLDVRFLARAEPTAEPVTSAESLQVRWWPVDDLPTDAPDMVELVRLGLARLNS